MEYLEIVSLVLTLVALFIASWQVLQIRIQKKETKEQLDELSRIKINLGRIETSLSTSYINLFPNYHEDIAGLISRAKSSIILFYDIPAYGMMSNYQGWLKIKYALEKQIANGISVEVYLYNDALRQEIFKEQFKNSEDYFKDWIKVGKNKTMLNKFLKHFDIDRNVPAEKSLDNYVYTSLKIQRDQQKIFKAENVTVKEVSDLMPIYYWARDRNTEGIFAIPSFSEKASELGFQTFDKNILEAFEALRKRYDKRLVQKTNNNDD